MKGSGFCKAIFVAFLFCGRLSAQTTAGTDPDLTGLWKGALYNDTTRQYLPYQIAISEEKGKLTGYSYTLFDIDGKKEMGVKRIKLKRTSEGLNIEDVELISNNYSAPPPRGVRQESELLLSVHDTAMELNGRWKTNRTRMYLPLTGSLHLQRSIDYQPEVLFQKLVELRLDKDLSFVKYPAVQIAGVKSPTVPTKSPVSAVPGAPDPDKPREIAAAPADTNKQTTVDAAPKPVAEAPLKTVEPIAEPEKFASRVDAPQLAIIATAPARQLYKAPARQGAFIAANKLRERLVAHDTRRETYLAAMNKPAPEVPAARPAVAVAKEPAKKPAPEPAVKTAAIKPPPANQPVTRPAVATAKKEPEKPAAAPVVTVAETVKKEPTVTAPAANVAVEIAERKMKTEQSVYFESDSLVLTLYDNGEVDGDTVSVLMNGQVIFAKQGLSTKANTKTIYVEPATDTLSMVMYAENLGSIPPNTGLLIIMDGEKRYEVRFSADLKTNAAILLKRRLKGS